MQTSSNRSKEIPLKPNGKNPIARGISGHEKGFGISILSIVSIKDCRRVRLDIGAQSFNVVSHDLCTLF